MVRKMEIAIEIEMVREMFRDGDGDSSEISR
jgi:hypothetical protein